MLIGIKQASWFNSCHGDKLPRDKNQLRGARTYFNLQLPLRAHHIRKSQLEELETTGHIVSTVENRESCEHIIALYSINFLFLNLGPLHWGLMASTSWMWYGLSMVSPGYRLNFCGIPTALTTKTCGNTGYGIVTPNSLSPEAGIKVSAS